MGPFLTVGRRAGVQAGEEVVDKPNKRVKKGENKTDSTLRPTASTSRTEQWFKDRPEDLRRGEMEEKRKGRCNTRRERETDRERRVLGAYW